MTCCKRLCGIISAIKNAFFGLKGLLVASLFVGSLGIAHATTGCNAVGWTEKHGMIGCNLYYPAVQWMYEEGIASGDAATGKFHPERTINRAEFTKLVLLASGVKNPPACKASPFPDVPTDTWFASYVCAAKDKGIISGFPDGTFKPALQTNFANSAKILANTFKIPLEPADANYDSEQTIWYRPYTLGLLNKDAVAPTVQAFDQLLTRGEMAEMLYRLATGKNYFEDPIETGDSDYLGLGFGPYDMETKLGINLTATPDVPYVFAPSERQISHVFTKDIFVKGHAFSHVLQQERCSLSGLWEHCTPTFADWTIGFYAAPALSFSKDYRDIGLTQRYFGGKPGDCVQLGVEGENIEYCIVPLTTAKSMVVVREFIDTNVLPVEGATPPDTSDAYYARIRKSMIFVNQ